ncbi:caspase-9 isoform X1 [Denticeps clupeoides]|nr:caspase-9 isoform X1 [Denticeps clupeoides]XP_028849220.1 caspase-9 isoform X1 [Denticeps clupeoides]XP_028849221.1 caspase-9 isoform X1 [Denticeps clupeoides]
MDPRHKKILQYNRINIVKVLDPSKISGELLKRGIFSQDMMDEITKSGTRRDQARQLIRDLETRGAKAFPAFLECLSGCGYQDLADLLQKENQTSPHHPGRLPPVDLPIYNPIDIRRPDRVPGPQPKEVPLHPGESNVFPAPSPGERETDCRTRRTRRDSLQVSDTQVPVHRELCPCPVAVLKLSFQTYKMDASPCGLCLIINNVEFRQLSDRSGSDIDCDKLERRFRSLNFIVTVRRNLKQKQIKMELSSLAKKDHSGYDCCVVVLLSHGAEVSHNRFPGAVYGVDALPVPVQLITNYLNGQNCPSLQSKPKLFFIQACGGDEKDTGFEVSPDEVEPRPGGADDQMDAIPTSSSSDSLSTSDEPDARTSLPTPSDILVSYSTFPGYVSWRDTQAGSWYVENLDRILEENAATDDLVTMLMMVNDVVSQNSAKGLYKQMPGSFNFLRKHLYFQAPPGSRSPA